MRKILVVAFGITSFVMLAGLQPAPAAQNCKQVCDQWAPNNFGKPRCFSARTVCTKASGSAGGSGAPQPIQQGKLRCGN
jgi:hypothetical protein